MKVANKHWIAPQFSAPFYLAKYPDVQRSGQDAWRHYLSYGWKEGRDPSASFSTQHYLTQYKEDLPAGQDPLTHFSRHGAEEELSPHPFLRPLDESEFKIGVVVLSKNFRSPEIRLKREQSTVEAHILSMMDRKNPKEQLYYVGDDSDAVARVNQALAHLDDQHCSHIHFCYSDDEFTHDGLKGLVAIGHPLVAPAFWGKLGPQFVPEMGFEYSASAFVRFARLWQRSFSKRLLFTSHVDASFALVRNDLLKKLSGFDEKYIDFDVAFADFCMRTKKIGIDPAVARHCVGRSLEPIQNNNNTMKKKGFYHLRAILAPQHPALSADLSSEISSALYCDINNRENSFSLAVQKFQNSALQMLTEKTVHTTHETSSRLKKAEAWYQLVTKEILSFNENEQTVLDIPFIEPVLFDGDGFIEPVGLSQNVLFRDMEAALAPFLGATDKDLRPLLGTLAIKLSEIFAGEAPILFSCGNHDPVRSNPNDGYVQRIRVIDSLVAGRARFYLNFAGSEEEPFNLLQLSPKLWVLNCRVDLEAARAFLAILINRIGFIYIHSPLAIPNYEIARLLCAAQPPLCLDAHGVAPEELKLAGDDELAENFAVIEETLVKSAQHIICVSNAMVMHFRQKYPQNQASFITVPIITNKMQKGIFEQPLEAAQKPLIIYAGGAQPWQCLPEMCRFLVMMKGRAEYSILSPAVEEMLSALCEAGEKEEYAAEKVMSVASDDVEKWLNSAQYGILLRQDIVVNRVSCPTKLIEYLTCDLVPILACSDIGDLKEFGFHYLHYQDVLQNGLPSEEARLLMVEHNRKAMNAYQSFIKTGWQHLQNLLG